MKHNILRWLFSFSKMSLSSVIAFTVYLQYISCLVGVLCYIGYPVYLNVLPQKTLGLFPSFETFINRDLQTFPYVCKHQCEPQFHLSVRLLRYIVSIVLFYRTFPQYFSRTVMLFYIHKKIMYMSESFYILISIWNYQNFIFYNIYSLDDTHIIPSSHCIQTI